MWRQPFRHVVNRSPMPARGGDGRCSFDLRHQPVVVDRSGRRRRPTGRPSAHVVRPPRCTVHRRVDGRRRWPAGRPSAGPRSTASVRALRCPMCCGSRTSPTSIDRAAAYLEPMDYLNARFTGCIAATANSAMPLALTDNRRLGATVWSDELIERAGVDASSLARSSPVASGAGDRSAARSPMRSACARDVEVGDRRERQHRRRLRRRCVRTWASGDHDRYDGVLTVHHPVRHVATEKFIVTMPSALEDRYYVVAEAGLGRQVVRSSAQRGDRQRPSRRAADSRSSNKHCSWPASRHPDPAA